MSVRIVILGMLQWGDQHGYELKQRIEQKMGDWTSIAFGSIYFALNKLAEEGLVEQVAVERHGNRPSRSVYRVTETGRVEYRRLLRELWSKPKRQYYDLDIALFFHQSLPADEVAGYLEHQIASQREVLEHLEVHRAATMANPFIPRLAGAIFDHSKAHFEAELRWLESVLNGFRSGVYP